MHKKISKQINLESKECPRCKVVKEKKEYNKSSARTDKMAVYCRVCEKIYKEKRSADKLLNDMYGII